MSNPEHAARHRERRRLHVGCSEIRLSLAFQTHAAVWLAGRADIAAGSKGVWRGQKEVHFRVAAPESLGAD